MPTRRVRLIGLTGGIGSGKSTAARFFAEAGAQVVDADQVARRVVEPGRPALEELRQEFGDGVFHADGTLNRAALGARVFHDPAARARLNAIMHPRIEAEAAREAAAARERDPQGLVVYDVPLLFESGQEGRFDLVVTVYVPRDEQRRRLMARDGLSAEDAEARLSSQLDIEEKARRAQVVLDNQGPTEALRRQVHDLLQRVRRQEPGN